MHKTETYPSTDCKILVEIFVLTIHSWLNKRFKWNEMQTVQRYFKYIALREWHRGGI